MESLSLPVPSLVICEMLGVPYADHEFFQEHTVKVIKQSTPPEERWAAMEGRMSPLGQAFAECGRIDKTMYLLALCDPVSVEETDLDL